MAEPAVAQVQPAGTGEPAFSNPSCNVSHNGGSLWANWSGVATLQHGGR